MTQGQAQIPAKEKIHPAAEWAASQVFSTTEIDCTITVVLKILDGKCKMLPGEKAAIMEIHDAVDINSGGIFSAQDRLLINMARYDPSQKTMQQIHQLRVYAESRIAKPVMKRYKARLRDGLFG